jgi:putative flippase GtrA
LSTVETDSPDAIDRLARIAPSPLRALLATEQGRYLVVAGTTALFYLTLVAVGLYAGLAYMIAIGMAQVVTISAAFPTYRTLVFRSHGPRLPDLWRFLQVWSGGMIAGLVATPFLVEFARIPPLPAQVLAVGGIAVASYLGHRFYSFRQREPRDVKPHGDAP